jgi:hypothetical protein
MAEDVDLEKQDALPYLSKRVQCEKRGYGSSLLSDYRSSAELPTAACEGEYGDATDDRDDDVQCRLYILQLPGMWKRDPERHFGASMSSDNAGDVPEVSWP